MVGWACHLAHVARCGLVCQASDHSSAHIPHASRRGNTISRSTPSTKFDGSEFDVDGYVWREHVTLKVSRNQRRQPLDEERLSEIEQDLQGILSDRETTSASDLDPDEEPVSPSSARHLLSASGKERAVRGMALPPDNDPASDSSPHRDPSITPGAVQNSDGDNSSTTSDHQHLSKSARKNLRRHERKRQRLEEQRARRAQPLPTKAQPDTPGHHHDAQSPMMHLDAEADDAGAEDSHDEEQPAAGANDASDNFTGRAETVSKRAAASRNRRRGSAPAIDSDDEEVNEGAQDEAATAHKAATSSQPESKDKQKGDDDDGSLVHNDEGVVEKLQHSSAMLNETHRVVSASNTPDDPDAADSGTQKKKKKKKKKKKPKNKKQVEDEGMGANSSEAASEHEEPVSGMQLKATPSAQAPQSHLLHEAPPKFDYYISSSQATVTFYLKGMDVADLTVTADRRRVALRSTAEAWQLGLCLSDIDAINPDKVQLRVRPLKVELLCPWLRDAAQLMPVFLTSNEVAELFQAADATAPPPGSCETLKASSTPNRPSKADSTSVDATKKPNNKPMPKKIFPPSDAELVPFLHHD
ncbi:uncharacterized protein MONBRDRAFT_37698, partial [Monosiga brevicollis MX1]